MGFSYFGKWQERAQGGDEMSGGNTLGGDEIMENSTVGSDRKKVTLRSSTSWA